MFIKTFGIDRGKVASADSIHQKHDNSARLDGGTPADESAANVSQQLGRAKQAAKAKIKPAKQAI